MIPSDLGWCESDAHDWAYWGGGWFCVRCGVGRAGDPPDHSTITVDRYGGTYAIKRVPWRWWQRPRWAWRLGWSVAGWWQR